MIDETFPLREKAFEYLFNLEAMTTKEAKRLWRESIKAAWGNRCAYCDNPPIDDKSLTVDHVRPKSRGGEDRTSNCVPACSECNHSKGSSPWQDWYRNQEFFQQANEDRIQQWLKTGKVFDCCLTK